LQPNKCLKQAARAPAPQRAATVVVVSGLGWEQFGYCLNPSGVGTWQGYSHNPVALGGNTASHMGLTVITHLYAILKS